MIKIQTILDVYYRAMLASYFGSGQNNNVITIENDGLTVTTYSEGEGFIVTDSYKDTGGNTEIYYQGDLVWSMTYSGSYSKEAIPTLMAAIKSNLVNRIFLGGRGPECFGLGIYIYENKVESNDPMDFRGTEKIYVPGSVLKTAVLGYHQYTGRANTDLVEV